ncbi:MAG: efflux transporter periplasmic adaptor subunit [Akkermansiaceae bacterium]|nr:efflux transporter periplasmic adaptor subunit [Akkermansiaceae bacterium]
MLRTAYLKQPFQKSHSSFIMRPALFLTCIPLLILPSCKKKDKAAGGPPPPAAVTFSAAASETVAVTRELPGRVESVRVAEVRARVPGILLERVFKEGADVKAGDILFKIDPAPLEAARDNAQAALVRTQATLAQTSNDVNRYRGLVQSKAVSQQTFDNANAANLVADAEVKAAEAALKTADLNLGYAVVTAPIDGRIGRAQVTEGALVGQGDATLMATIQQLSPVYFDFTQSVTDMLSLRRAMESGEFAKADPSKSAAKLILEDGTEYAQPAKILFSEAVVDESTSMVTLRAEIPNPDKILLPGMFARIRVVQAVRENVVTVPQRAVTRGPGGIGTVMIVDDGNKAQVRTIKTDTAVADKWVVTSGLKAGEKVIMEGLLKARPGADVKPEPYVPPAPAAEDKDAKKG